MNGMTESKRALINLLDAIGVQADGAGGRSVGIPNLDQFWAAYDAAVVVAGRSEEMIIYS